MMKTRYMYFLCWISEKKGSVGVIVVVNQQMEYAAFCNNSYRLKKENNFANDSINVLYRCFVFWRRWGVLGVYEFYKQTGYLCYHLNCL